MQRETQIAHIVLAALSAASLALLSMPLSSPVRSVKGAVGYAFDPMAYYGDRGAARLAGVPERLRGLLSADLENRRLSEEVRRAEWLKTTVESLSLENQRLRAALGLKIPDGRDPLWARVLERAPEHWYRSVTIDAGASSGLSPGDAVLARAGERLVAAGRVVEARPETATVLLLTDQLSSAAAYLSSGTVEGLVQGQDGPRLRMNYISADAAVAPGDSVYTSPTSAVFPPDVPVGRVAGVFARDPFLTFQSVEVAPALAEAALHEVVILRARRARAAEAP